MAYGSISETGENKFRVCFDYGTMAKMVPENASENISFSPPNVKQNMRSTAIGGDGYRQLCDAARLDFYPVDGFWYDNIILPQIEATTAYGYKSI